MADTYKKQSIKLSTERLYAIRREMTYLMEEAREIVHASSIEEDHNIFYRAKEGWIDPMFFLLRNDYTMNKTIDDIKNLVDLPDNNTEEEIFFV